MTERSSSQLPVAATFILFNVFVIGILCVRNFVWYLVYTKIYLNLNAVLKLDVKMYCYFHATMAKHFHCFNSLAIKR